VATAEAGLPDRIVFTYQGTGHRRHRHGRDDPRGFRGENVTTIFVNNGSTE